MADRVTKVRLEATYADYVNGVDAAVKKTKELSVEEKALAEQHAQISVAAGKAALAVGALAAAGVALSINKFADFDKQMSAVQAATHESAENMGLLREAAINAGADTVFSATEAAQAVEELAKAGVSAKDVLGGGLKGSLDLAAAGELAVGDAAEIAATALTQFKLKGSDVPHVADLLAAGAGKAQGSVTDLSGALKQSGLVASQMGLSIEETTGTLAAFAASGLTGSDAGTAFRTMLLRLSNPAKDAKNAMDDLGISVYDASGQFVGMESVAGQLRSKLGGLTQAQRDQKLATIFGSDAIRAANVLYSESATGIADWTEKVNDQGYAAETAALRMDNLAGDIEKLGGAMDTALIKTGSAANDALRGLVQGVTAAVDAFGNAPQPVQTTALFLGVATAAIGLVGGTALIAVPKIAAFKVALETLGVSATKTNAAMGGLTLGMKALGAVGLVASIAAVTSQLIDQARVASGTSQSVDTLSKAYDKLGAKGTVDTGLQDNIGRGVDLGSLTDQGMWSDVQTSIQKTLGTVVDWNVGMKAVGVDTTLATRKIETIDKTMAAMVASGKTDDAAAMYEALAAKTNGSKDALEKLNGLLPEYTAAQKGAKEVTGDTSTEMETFTSVTESAETALSDFVTALHGLGDTQLELNAANRKVEASLDDFQAKLKENGQTLDIGTDKGRENAEALDAIGEAYKNQAAALVQNTGKQEDAIPVIEAGRQAVIDAGKAAGLSAEQAGAYADSLGLIPKNVQTVIDLKNQQAMQAAEAFAQKLKNIPNSKEVYLYINEQRIQSGAPQGQLGAAYDGNANGGMHAYANGGFGAGIYKGGAPLYKFAEPETRWEAFISGKPGQEERNRGIALDAYQRLGGTMPEKSPVNVTIPVTTRDIESSTLARVLGREIVRGLAGR